MNIIVTEGTQIPKVQVERYISPILAVFLEDILYQLYKKEYKMISPEFPIRKGSIDYKSKRQNQSTNIDYLMYNKTDNKLVFIELKTDSTSFKSSQLEIYQKLQEICENNTTQETFGELLINDLKKIKKASKFKSKYEYIISQLDNSFTLINKMEIIYIVPKNIINKVDGKQVLSFYNLPKKLNHFNNEWQIIRKYLVQLDEN